jgi:hypothetical protein
MTFCFVRGEISPNGLENFVFFQQEKQEFFYLGKEKKNNLPSEKYPNNGK